jgi:CRISPR-associated protein Cas1
MIKRTLCFNNPAYLSLRSNQLVIKLPGVADNETLPEKMKDDTVRTIPLEDIGIFVLDNSRITITSGLVEALLENDTAIITCDGSHLPVGLLLPLSGNSTQNERFRSQIQSSIPLRKQLWQQTIQYKIHNQAAVLKQYRAADIRLMQKWADNVKSGDVDNTEAKAAAYYWKTLFPEIENFTRDREGIPPNNLLNYGYAILRAIVARGLVISGLLPTLGIHHHNRYNAYCLADDIMEPYRPYVDMCVLRIMQESPNYELSMETKARLLAIPVLDVVIEDERSPLMIAVSCLFRLIVGQ